jgi:hypothetical protein
MENYYKQLCYETGEGVWDDAKDNSQINITLETSAIIWKSGGNNCDSVYPSDPVINNFRRRWWIV